MRIELSDKDLKDYFYENKQNDYHFFAELIDFSTSNYEAISDTIVELLQLLKNANEKDLIADLHNCL
ncbi:MAG: hypothetical protein U9N85_01185 [Bacteroidota bacterium]|nr:hypothetical protein [Bacteroidota bacterium]